MSSAGDNLGYYGLGLAAANIAFATFALWRPKATAEANRTFIESGEETYFEQRRAWKAYGTTPETDPDRVRRRAIWFIALNLLVVGSILLSEWLW